jgi:death-on-curing protein
VTRYLNAAEILDLHRLVIERWGGAAGIRDIGGLASAIAQPRQTFGGRELYPDIAAKASALGFLLALNHPFVDGNKRVAHAAMEVFLLLNGYQLNATVDEQEQVMVKVAGGTFTHDQFLTWTRTHLVPSAFER